MPCVSLLSGQWKNACFIAVLSTAIMFSGGCQFFDAQTRARMIAAADDANAGNALLKQGDYAQATRRLTAAIEKSPSSALYTNRGVAFHLAGDLDAATKDCTRAIELDPNNALASNNRGVIRLGTGDVDGAILDFRRALETNPSYENAEKNLLAAVKQGPSGAPFAVRLDSSHRSEANALAQGNECYKNEDYNGAIAAYTESLAASPSPEAYTNRGAAYLAMGNTDAAIQDFSMALALNPKDIKALNNRGVAWARKHAYAHALADCNQAIEINQNYAVARNNRAIVADRLDSALDSPKRASAPTIQKPAPEDSAGEVVFEPVPQRPATPTANASRHDSGDADVAGIGNGKYSLHVASFREMKNAEAAMNRLRRQTGADVTFKEVLLFGNEKWYRVYLGHHKTRKSAEDQGERLMREGVLDYFAVRSS